MCANVPSRIPFVGRVRSRVYHAQELVLAGMLELEEEPPLPDAPPPVVREPLQDEPQADEPSPPAEPERPEPEGRDRDGRQGEGHGEETPA